MSKLKELFPYAVASLGRVQVGVVEGVRTALFSAHRANTFHRPTFGLLSTGLDLLPECEASIDALLAAGLSTLRVFRDVSPETAALALDRPLRKTRSAAEQAAASGIAIEGEVVTGLAEEFVVKTALDRAKKPVRTIVRVSANAAIRKDTLQFVGDVKLSALKAALQKAAALNAEPNALPALVEIDMVADAVAVATDERDAAGTGEEGA